MNNIIRNILFISLPTILFLFIVLEISVRILKEPTNLLELTGKKERENPMKDWAKNDAYSSYQGKSGLYTEDKTINSSGFISTPEISLEKPDQGTRVVFLGGSSTAGAGKIISDEQTWPWIVCDILEEKTNNNIDFINAALAGYTSFESYGRLWSRIRFYKPDIVVVYHGWNDMYYFSEDFNKNPLSWKSWDINAPIVLQTIEAHWIDKFISWSQVLSKLRYKIIRQEITGELKTGDESGMNDFKETNIDKGLVAFQQNLDLIQAFCELHNISFFVCKQATLITPETSEADRTRCSYELHGFGHDEHILAFNKIYDMIDSEYEANSVIDVTSLSGQSEYFYDHIHPTELGTSKIANIVADSIINNHFNNQ